MSDLDLDLAAVAAVVEPLLVEAGELTLRWFRNPLNVVDKGGAAGYDPVTEADRGAESLLRVGLAARFPEHAIVGEEEGMSGTEGRVRWVIDPIDGTRAFITGMPAWGILLGLVVDEQPVAGWVRQPFLRETFAALDGTGWYERDGARTPLRTSMTGKLDDASLYSTHPTMFTGPRREPYEELAHRVRLQRFGGDCYSYCLLALGHVDLVVEAGLHPHDIVPLVPIIEAAGGVVTDIDGKVPLDGGFIVAAATTDLHAAALDVLRNP